MAQSRFHLLPSNHLSRASSRRSPRMPPLDLFRNGNRLGKHEVRVRVARQDLGDRRLRRKLRRGWHRRPTDLHFLAAYHACTGRGAVTEGDVLLESEQLATLATNRRIGKTACRIVDARLEP